MKLFNRRNVLLLVLALVALGAYAANEAIGKKYAYVSEEDNPSNAELVNAYTEEDVISGEKKVGADYFVSYRLQREQTRADNIETLTAVSVSADSDSSSADPAREQIVALVKLSEQELILENLIKSKGFSDCVVFIHSGHVNVLVDSEEVTSSQAVQIRDLVASECGVALENVTIASTGQGQ